MANSRSWSVPYPLILYLATDSIFLPHNHDFISEAMNLTEFSGTTTDEVAAIYNSHVKSYPDYPGMKTPYTSLDLFLGLILLLCALVGIPGNILGAFFFSSKTRKDLVTSLYIVICAIDSVTALAHLPVAIALFRGRKPGVFNEYLFCALWEVVYTVLQKMSIFLVLLLSISRTVAIVKPFYKIVTGTVMGCVVGYQLLLLLIPLLQYLIIPLRGEYKYSWDGAYCYYNFQMKFEHAVNLVMVGLPPIITFITLLVSITKLHYSAKVSAAGHLTVKTPGSPRTKMRETGRHRASITIAMFTGLFLMCNLPLFINLMHNMTTRFFGVKYPGVYFSTRFMFWYSWHIAKMESVVVNAALNPVLYYRRMKRFRAWCKLLISCKSIKQEDLSETFTRRFTQMQTRTSRLNMVCSAVRVVKHLRVETSKVEDKLGSSQCYRLEEEGDTPSSEEHVVSAL